jgi:phage shock protein A
VLLDTPEDPPRIVARLIREMEDGLDQVRAYAAATIAAERRLSRELACLRAHAAYWRQEACQALRGRDSAGQAVTRRSEYEELVRDLEGQFADVRETRDEARICLHTLQARLEAARRKRRALQARQQAALARAYRHHDLSVQAIDPGGVWACWEHLETALAHWEDALLNQPEVFTIPDGLEERDRRPSLLADPVQRQA